MISDKLVSEAAAKLEALRSLVSEDPLHESGRHFVDGSYSNLTSCHHGDTGEFHNDADGEAISILWNLWRLGAIEIKPLSKAKDLRSGDPAIFDDAEGRN